jgi:hypothetical protein
MYTHSLSRVCISNSDSSSCSACWSRRVEPATGMLRAAPLTSGVARRGALLNAVHGDANSAAACIQAQPDVAGSGLQTKH